MTTWMAEALCAEAEGNLWFPDVNSPDAKYAKSICAECPVVDECLDYAVQNKIVEGIWGGMTPNERKRKMKGRQRRGEE